MPNGWSVYADIWLNGWGVLPSVEDTLVNTGTSSQSVLSADAEAITNSATSTQVIAEVPQGQDVVLNSATSSQIVDSADAEAIHNRGPPSPENFPTILDLEVVADTLVNTATSSQTISEEVSTPLANEATNLPTVLEAEAEALGNSATSSPSISVADSESVSNSASSSQNLDSADADTGSNSGSSSQSVGEADAESISNSETSSQSILESDVDEVVNQGASTQTISTSPVTTDVARVSLGFANEPGTRTNHSIHIRARVQSGSGVIKAILYEGSNNRSGILTSAALTTSLVEYVLNISDVNAETITDYSNLEIAFWGYSDSETATVFEVDQVWLEIPAVAAEPLTNTGTSAPSLSEAEAESQTNSATSTQTISEEAVLYETPLQNVGTGAPSITEASETRDTLDNSASSTQIISSADADEQGTSGASSQTSAEATSESVLNSGTSTQEIDEFIYLPSDEESIDNTGTAVHSLAEEAILFEQPLQNVADNLPTLQETSLTTESLTNEAESSQTLVEEDVSAETLTTSAESTQTIDEAVASPGDTLTSEAQSTQIISEAIAEDVDSEPPGGGGTPGAGGEGEELFQRNNAALSILEQILGEVIPEPEPTYVPPADIATFHGRSMSVRGEVEITEELTSVGNVEHGILEEVERIVVQQLDPITETVFTESPPKTIVVEKEIIREITIVKPGGEREVVTIDSADAIEDVIKKAVRLERAKYESELFMLFNELNLRRRRSGR